MFRLKQTTMTERCSSAMVALRRASNSEEGGMWMEEEEGMGV